MKKLLILLLFITPLLLPAQYIPDSIFAEVNGNYVKVYDIGASRICSYTYDHVVIRIDSSNFEWHQNYATGWPVYCVCSFDYMVEIGPFDAGTYNIDVYYTDYQPIYLGNAEFVIENSSRQDTIELISSYSSDCYTVGTDEYLIKVPVVAYPNPATTYVKFDFAETKTFDLVIFDPIGRIVHSTSNNPDKSYTWLIESTIMPGLYIYNVKNEDGVYTGKFIMQRN